VAAHQVAREREVEGDVVLSDLGEGVPFRAGAFDGAISIRQPTLP
jgi:18S rRNA (guanine1575-N7)-methyltransferase